MLTRRRVGVRRERALVADGTSSATTSTTRRTRSGSPPRRRPSRSRRRRRVDPVRGARGHRSRRRPRRHHRGDGHPCGTYPQRPAPRRSSPGRPRLGDPAPFPGLTVSPVRSASSSWTSSPRPPTASRSTTPPSRPAGRCNGVDLAGARGRSASPTPSVFAEAAGGLTVGLRDELGLPRRNGVVRPRRDRARLQARADRARRRTPSRSTGLSTASSSASRASPSGWPAPAPSRTRSARARRSLVGNARRRAPAVLVRPGAHRRPQLPLQRGGRTSRTCSRRPAPSASTRAPRAARTTSARRSR